MKTIFNKYISVSLLLIMGLSSCSDDFLEEKKQYRYYDESFLENETRVNQYVNNLYYDFYDGYKSPLAIRVASWTTTETSYTEELGGISNLINPGVTLQNADDGSSYYGNKLGTTLSNNPYTRIRDCNFLLDNLDRVGAALSQTFRDQIKGQVYFLRAIQYFDLMRTYGGVPIVTSVSDANSIDESIKIPRATVTETVNQIVADLDLAATLLPGNWGASDYGRFTRGAALAQKSRVLLTYASPLFNKNWDTSTARWDAALAASLAAETQLTTDGYGLYGTNAKQWAEMFYINDNAKNSEAIVVKLLANGTSALYSNNGWEKSIRLASQGGAAGSGVKVPKRMIDLFPMADGTRPMNDITGTAINGYDPFLFFKGRDPRFYRTFGFSGCYWPYTNSLGNTTQPTVWAYRWAPTTTSTSFGFSMGNDVPSPAFVRKMSSPTVSNTSNFQYSGTDIMEYRFAELLLNIAECYAAKGDVANTLVYLGKIRNRVGIPSTNNYGIGTLADKYAALEAVLYERRVELAYEGKRFWDVQRWMLYSDDSSVNVDNTNTKLNIPAINGTQRIGNYLHCKALSAVGTDPLTSARAAISVDPDNANFTTQINALAAFYTANFELKSPPSPMDNVSSVATNILWRPNYYLFGLTATVLSQNPWLIQTKGWNDATNTMGTYDYQE
ncbi:RagB/SusD family nutrient uptake outer membrane protein [Flavobacterium sp. MAHUQ-51]|uniref:RagB/SusD family nutrient uptake outer membrane protein n=1 Tax=Flavobacterium sp. GCM10022190 TaxID=3252639 RepID=UPI003614C45B